MRAYLTKLDKEDTFYEKVNEVAKKAMPKAKEFEADELDSTDGGAAALLESRSREWGDISLEPVLFVQVADFALITAAGHWCPAPKNPDIVQKRFQALLDVLDPIE